MVHSTTAYRESIEYSSSDSNSEEYSDEEEEESNDESEDDEEWKINETALENIIKSGCMATSKDSIQKGNNNTNASDVDR